MEVRRNFTKYKRVQHARVMWKRDNDSTTRLRRDPMKDVVLAVSIFHVMAAAAMFAFCVFTVIRVVQQRSQR
jgi:hypothetical protein